MAAVKHIPKRRIFLWIAAILLILGIALVVFLSQGEPAPVSARPLDPSERALVERAGEAGLADASGTVRTDGGLLVEGELEGLQVSLAFPADWNGDAALFAHGYSVPGMSTAVARDIVAADPSRGILTAAYADKLAIGHSAYKKAGMGVEAGAKATLALRNLTKALGAKRVFVSGMSMGGNIVMALIEKDRDAFSGAIAACGVTGGWQTELQALIDMRAVYDAMTLGTKYELPGAHDLNRSALSPVPPSALGFATTPWRLVQMKRIAGPVETLFEDADADPRGDAARIVAVVASLTPFESDAASFLFPLTTVALGQDDLRKTFGGNVYGNAGKTYRSSVLDTADNKALNRKIARLEADPAAQRYARTWHRTQGDFDVPLVTIHNRIDALVPYRQAKQLRQAVDRAGNLNRLTQFTVPPVIKAVPGTGITGFTHCGFDPKQMAQVWSTLYAKRLGD